jgi:RNA polymerase sigma factor (sigma-70 family)
MQQAEVASADSSNHFSSIVAASSGSDLAFEAILEPFAREIRAVAHRRRRHGVDIADLEQSARIALWRTTFSYDANRGLFHHYARRAIKNAVRTEIGFWHPLTDQGEAVTQTPGEATDDTPDDTVVEPTDPFVTTRIRAWVQSLREPLQRIYALIYQQELSQREAARILGVSQPRVAELHAELLDCGRGALSHLTA